MLIPVEGVQVVLSPEQAHLHIHYATSNPCHVNHMVVLSIHSGQDSWNVPPKAWPDMVVTTPTLVAKVFLTLADSV